MSDFAPSQTPGNRTGFLSINRTASSSDITPPSSMSDLRSMGQRRERPDADALEKHRINSNAFYQQDVRRNITPIEGQPANYDESFNAASREVGPRASQATTFSRFINAGSSPQQHEEQLRLVPEGRENAVPTSRGMIEERREYLEWKASGKRDDERVPVYYSPKLPDEPLDSGKRTSGSSQPRSRSPKKAFLDRFNFSKNKLLNKEVSQPLPFGQNLDIAPKAAAILGTSVSSSKIPVTPDNSLTKRANAQNRYADGGGPSSIVSAGLLSYTNRKSEPTYGAPPLHSASEDDNNNTGRRVVSQPSSSPDHAAEKAASAAALARSQSLHYYDKRAPPTPPSKDTPPEIKAAKQLATDLGNPSNSLTDPPKRVSEPSPAQPKTPHHQHRRTHTVADATPSKHTGSYELYMTPANRGGRDYGYGSVSHGRIKRIEHEEAASEEEEIGGGAGGLEQAVLVTADGREVTSPADIKEAEKSIYVRGGLNPEGELWPTTYSPCESLPDSPPKKWTMVKEIWTPGPSPSLGGGRGKVQHHRHSSPLLDYAAPSVYSQQILSPTRASKRVSFSPRHTSHHLDDCHPALDCETPTRDSNKYDEGYLPTHLSGAQTHVETQAPAKTQTPAKIQNATNVFDNMPDFSVPAVSVPATTSFASMASSASVSTAAALDQYSRWSPMANASAVPSPLNKYSPIGGNPFFHVLKGKNQSVSDNDGEEVVEEDDEEETETMVIGLGINNFAPDTKSLAESKSASSNTTYNSDKLSLRDRYSADGERVLDKEYQKILATKLNQLISAHHSLAADSSRYHDELQQLMHALNQLETNTQEIHHSNHLNANGLQTLQDKMGRSDGLVNTIIDNVDFNAAKSRRRISGVNDMVHRLDDMLRTLVQEFVMFEEQVDRMDTNWGEQQKRTNDAIIEHLGLVDRLDGRIGGIEEEVGRLSCLGTENEEQIGKIEDQVRMIDARSGKLEGVEHQVQKIRGLSNMMDEVCDQVYTLTETSDAVERRLDNLDGLAQKISTIEARISKLTALTDKIEEIGGRVDKVDLLAQRLDAMQVRVEKLDALTEQIEAIEARVGRVDSSGGLWSLGSSSPRRR